MSCPETRIEGGAHAAGKSGKVVSARMPDEEEDKTQQSIVYLRQLALSSIVMSHTNFVSDIQFIPALVKVDRKNPGTDG